MRFNKSKLLNLRKWQHLIVAIFFVVQFSLNEGIAADGANSGKPASDTSQASLQTSREKIDFYRWLVDEMYSQVMVEHTKNPRDLDGWINVFAQGASIEGVYHGLVLSTSYAAKETGTTAIKALRWYSQEMEFLDALSTQLDKKIKIISAEQYVKEKGSLPIYSLKREMGERLLREVELRKNDRKALTKWYGTLAARWAKLDIDFGMPERNKSDFDFHEDWATDNSVGILQWEILNRMHRTLNKYGGLHLPDRPKPSLQLDKGKATKAGNK